MLIRESVIKEKEDELDQLLRDMGGKKRRRNAPKPVMELRKYVMYCVHLSCSCLDLTIIIDNVVVWYDDRR